MKEKTRFAVVAAISAAAGVIVTTVVDRMAMKQDLEFLGIVDNDVRKGLAILKHKVEGDDGDGETNGGSQDTGE